MPESLWLAAALVASIAGMGWLALAMAPHWIQVCRDSPLTPRRTAVLRTAGAASLFVSLLLCLQADHASMAALVWVMALTLGALAVAVLLAWRPRWLRALLPGCSVG